MGLTCQWQDGSPRLDLQIKLELSLQGGQFIVLYNLDQDLPPIVRFSIFQVVSAYTNTGMSLSDESMVPFQQAYPVILVMVFLVLAGNTAFVSHGPPDKFTIFMTSVITAYLVSHFHFFALGFIHMHSIDVIVYDFRCKFLSRRQIPKINPITQMDHLEIISKRITYQRNFAFSPRPPSQVFHILISLSSNMVSSDYFTLAEVCFIYNLWAVETLNDPFSCF